MSFILKPFILLSDICGSGCPPLTGSTKNAPCWRCVSFNLYTFVHISAARLKVIHVCYTRAWQSCLSSYNCQNIDIAEISWPMKECRQQIISIHISHCLAHVQMIVVVCIYVRSFDVIFLVIISTIRHEFIRFIHMIASVPVKESWKIRVNFSTKSEPCA